MSRDDKQKVTVEEGDLKGETIIHLPDGEYIVSTTRYWASAVIRAVADHCADGAFPPTITAFDLGRAVARAAVNAPRDDHASFAAEFLHGYTHVVLQRQILQEHKHGT